VGIIEKTKLELELEDYKKVKVFIDPSQSNKTASSTTRTQGGLEHAKTMDTLPSKKRPTIDLTRSDSINNPLNSNPQQKQPPQALNRASTSNAIVQRNPSEPYRPVNPDPVMDYVEQRSMGVTVYNTQSIMYVRNLTDEFNYNRSIFLETSPHYNEIVTSYDTKYFNALMYAFLSNYLNLESIGKEGTVEKITLLGFKNKLRLTLRETKIIETLFKIKMKNKLDYQYYQMKEKSFLDIVIQNLERFVNKQKHKLIKKFSKTEDYDYVMNILKHFFILLAQNVLWQSDSSFKLKLTEQTEQEKKMLHEAYEEIVQFFFKAKPENYAEVDFQGEIQKIMKNPLINRSKMNISFPVNMQICESMLLSLIESKEDDQVLILSN